MKRLRWPPPPDGGPRSSGPGPSAPRSGRPTLPMPPTQLIETPHGGRLEQLVTGVGEPVTVFAHGLAGDIAGTRPLGSAVLGRRVFFHFRGHGRSEAPPGPWSFADLAEDLRAVADRAGASRALGVSMGAGALCRLLSATPDRFERIVLYLPSALDGVRPPVAETRLARLLAAVESGEAALVAEAVEPELPPSVRNTPTGWSYLRQRVEQLLTDGLAPELDTLWRAPAVPDESVLAAFPGRALVIGCVGDDVHPAPVAERLAGLLPDAELQIYDRPALLWTHRKELRERISTFLNPT
ncbi:alpha/beta hydrolase [Actinoplanes sp. ATCC 53533]|uniref:alpha/beta fold hydrolase n=1 Tax=Actinoplanes sp. ATCC 53533 TaxID=1288362 RepID=UPI000F78D11A|nr:alpha/beta fold hydrolase [Actinoplanes sp. ATCC 53533]RSM51733.1 alpha/beta hydrolase [Actinoplanes sp. ATCC 53533]